MVKFPGMVDYAGYTLEDAKGCVGKGWHKLLEVVWEALDPKRHKVIQVKEKWGCLRIYVDGTNMYFEGYLDGICAVSRFLCEECGEAGELRSRDWIRTLCNACNQRSDNADPRTGS